VENKFSGYFGCQILELGVILPVRNSWPVVFPVVLSFTVIFICEVNQSVQSKVVIRLLGDKGKRGRELIASTGCFVDGARRGKADGIAFGLMHNICDL
jgi:hypothetical protein